MDDKPDTRRSADAKANMLELVRYAAQHADVAVSKRDAAIREARRAGASFRDIAAESGLSHMTVKRIIDRAEPGSVRR